MKPHICPVCNGRGTVPPGFYNPSPDGVHGITQTDCHTETCRSCGGKGYILVPEEVLSIPSVWILDPDYKPPTFTVTTVPTDDSTYRYETVTQ